MQFISRTSMVLVMSLFILLKSAGAPTLASTALEQRAPNGDQTFRQSVTDYEQTVLEGAVLGALAGAALGAGITALAGGSDKQVAKAALVGGLFGGVAGASSGESIAQTKQQYVLTEEELDDLIKKAETNALELGTIVAAAELLLAKREKEKTELLEKIADKKTKKAQRKQLRKDLRQDLDAVKDAIRVANRERGQLEEGIRALESNQRSAETLTVALDANLASVQTLQESANALSLIRKEI
jgi:outer membrane lipoprotein SlyB